MGYVANFITILDILSEKNYTIRLIAVEVILTKLGSSHSIRFLVNLDYRLGLYIGLRLGKFTFALLTRQNFVHTVYLSIE